LLKAFGPVYVGVQSRPIPSFELYVVINADVAFECFGIVTVPTLWQDFCFAGLESRIVVVADLWKADLLESDWDGLWHVDDMVVLL